jgi:cyclomaltodextrinase / maltogenic alpha-amylase / neopullulanase
MKRIVFFIMITFFATATAAQSNSQKSVVPEWAKKAVWYQIFPERFANGDKANDPSPEDLKGSWPFYIPDGWQISPWTSDWYKLQPWEVKTGHDFYWNSGVRRYGGDLQGIINKLDYLKELGINAIYLNPIFESPSSHKYDAMMYHHIDNNFGSDPKKDSEMWAAENPGDASTWKWTTADKLFLKLISECHKRGMKIIIDGVFNHTGLTFWAFKDIQENQQNSKFKDWYTVKSWDDPKTEKNEFDYAGWLGIKDLPEIKEDTNGLVTGPRGHVHDIVKRWMDPNGDGNPADGIDGWRLDVAEMVNHNFWKEFRSWVKGINPNAYIVGEIWWDDWKNYKMMDATPWLKGDEFDAVMNYRFARAVKNFVINKKDQVNAQGFIDTVNTLYRQYPKENNYVMMNLFDSHDVERVASQIVNPDLLFDHDGNAQNKNFDVRKPTENEKLKQKLMVGIQFTMPGAPTIYYGDEVGMWGGDDPDCRKPMIWKEFSYKTETAQPSGNPRKPDEVTVDKKLFNWYKKMTSIRNRNEALALGNISFYKIMNEEKILAYARQLNNNEIFVIANNNSEEKEIAFDKNEFLNGKNSYSDLVSGKKFITVNEKFNMKLNPYQVLILK